MIKTLQFQDFKNFADETLRVGPFTVIVGVNASGKSNIRDAFRILHGMGRGYTLADIIGGKYGAGGHVEWEQIRGAANEINRFESNLFGLQVEMQTQRNGRSTTFQHRIEVIGNEGTQGGFRVAKEELRSSRGYEPTYTSYPLYAADRLPQLDDDRSLQLRMAKTGQQRKVGHRVTVRSDQPALTQIPE